MCSTWALAVFGAMSSSPAISAFGQTGCNELGHLELPRGEGPPRFVRLMAATSCAQHLRGGICQGSAAQAVRDRADLLYEGDGIRDAIAPEQDGRQIQRAQVPSQTRAASSQPRTDVSSAARA